jgi:[acyl-carrier-protein] S-malonyltransferase
MRRFACVFPTFAMRNRALFDLPWPEYKEALDAFVARAHAVVSLDWPPDTANTGEPSSTVEGAVQAQYACFLEGLAAAAAIERRFGPTTAVAGYSMGVFAAASHANALSLEDGLRIIEWTCSRVHRAVPHVPYAMGAIGGLTPEGVLDLLTELRLDVTIGDVYGRKTVIVSGRHDDVARVLEASVGQGAVYTKLTPATAPFHSPAVESGAEGDEDWPQGLAVMAPCCPIVSATTQQLLTRADEVREELLRNVSRPMNWYGTIRRLSDMRLNMVFECGTSDSLADMIRRDMPGTWTVLDPRDRARV